MLLTVVGEALKQKELQAAMASMDSDRSGTVEFDEFKTWWEEWGGDLEKRRDLAFTLAVRPFHQHGDSSRSTHGDYKLILVADNAG